MSDVYIVLKREFVERVRSKSFLLGTLLFPIFMIGIYALPILFGKSEGETRLVVVNEGPSTIGAHVQKRLEAPTETRDGRTYSVEVERAPLEALRPRLNARVNAKEIDGYVHIPPDVVQNGNVAYRARNVANFDVIGDVKQAASEAVQGARLQASGIDIGLVAQLVQPVRVQSARITEAGEEGGNAVGTFFFAYGAAFLIYLMILLYGMNVLRSVLEEKTNRIAEVIVSSVRASDLMLGKIVGVAAVSLLQVGIWAALVAIGVTQSGALSRRFGLPENAFAALQMRPGAALALLGFFILGFLLFAALFAAVGAAVNSEQEAQQSQTFVMLPLIIPLLFLGKVAGDPLGTTATVLGMIPFTAPVTNAMRLAATEVPALEIAASLTLLAATVVLVSWVAGKIYRVGILSTGKKPSLRELAHWLRAA